MGGKRNKSPFPSEACHPTILHGCTGVGGVEDTTYHPPDLLYMGAQRLFKNYRITEIEQDSPLWKLVPEAFASK